MYTGLAPGDRIETCRWVQACGYSRLQNYRVLKRSVALALNHSPGPLTSGRGGVAQRPPTLTVDWQIGWTEPSKCGAACCVGGPPMLLSPWSVTWHPCPRLHSRQPSWSALVASSPLNSTRLLQLAPPILCLTPIAPTFRQVSRVFTCSTRSQTAFPASRPCSARIQCPNNVDKLPGLPPCEAPAPARRLDLGN